MDWASRRVLPWQLSNILTTDFCMEALQEAIVRYGVPEIFNIDQGSPVHQSDLHATDQGPWYCHRHGWPAMLARQCVRRTVVEIDQVRGGVPAYDCVSAANRGIDRYLQFYNGDGRTARLTARRRMRSTSPICPHWTRRRR